MKAKAILLMLMIFSGRVQVICQELSPLQFLELSLEDQIEYFFTTYKDGHTHLGVSRYAGYIVTSYGADVIPYLKQYLQNANFLSLHKNKSIEQNPDFYKGEPNDTTLSLISYIWADLHVYANPIFSDIAPPYTLDEAEIQWFVNEYKERIDEYIITKKTIDETVMSSETMIAAIASYGIPENISKYGHPYFTKPVRFRGKDLKEYYEKRLGIEDLKIVPPFLE
jgi:hypothetical protein